MGQVNSVVVIDRLSVVFVVIMAAIFLGQALTQFAGRLMQ